MKDDLPDRYEYRETLGEGGIGVVIRAYDLSLDREVAIKMLATRSDEQIARFQREAKACARLEHENILSAFDFGLTENGANPYLVMDYLPGTNLDNLIKELGPLELDEALPIFKQIVSALKYAHYHDVIHRDIKPSNIMLIPRDDEYLVKIVDFGLAQLVDVDQHLTDRGIAMGSPLYMSPEQAKGEQVDTTTDIYSFGCVMYFVLTGRAPIQEETAIDTISKKLLEMAPTLRDGAPDIVFSPELESIVGKCLSNDMVNRFESIAEVESRLLKLDEPLDEIDTTEESDSATQPRSKLKPVVIIIAIGISMLVASLLLALNQGNETSSSNLQEKQPAEEKTDEAIKEAATTTDEKKFNIAAGKCKIIALSISDKDFEELENERKIKSLDLSGAQIDGSGLSFIERHRINELLLKQSSVRNAGLKHIGKLRKLQALDLSNCENIDEEGLEYLTSLKKLGKLHLKGCKGITNKSVDTLVKFKSLWLLDVRLTDTAERLSDLKALPNLNHLQIGGTAFDDTDLSVLTSLTKLTNLSIERTSVDLEPLEKLDRLTNLELKVIELPENLGQILSRMPTLHSLVINDPVELLPGQLASLRKAKHLEHLHLKRCVLSEDFLPALAQLKQLRTLTIFDDVTFDQLSRLRMALPKTKVLSEKDYLDNI